MMTGFLFVIHFFYRNLYFLCGLVFSLNVTFPLPVLNNNLVLHKRKKAGELVAMKIIRETKYLSEVWQEMLKLKGVTKRRILLWHVQDPLN